MAKLDPFCDSETQKSLCACACVRALVRARVRACVRACMRVTFVCALAIGVTTSLRLSGYVIMLSGCVYIARSRPYREGGDGVSGWALGWGWR